MLNELNIYCILNKDIAFAPKRDVKQEQRPWVLSPLEIYSFYLYFTTRSKQV